MLQVWGLHGYEFPVLAVYCVFYGPVELFHFLLDVYAEGFGEVVGGFSVFKGVVVEYLLCENVVVAAYFAAYEDDAVVGYASA